MNPASSAVIDFSSIMVIIAVILCAIALLRQGGGEE